MRAPRANMPSSALRLLCCCGALCACQPAPTERPVASPDAGADTTAEPAPFTLLVVLGDSVAVGKGVTAGCHFDQLLLHNDDALYPEYRGRDLATLYDRVRLVNLASVGADSAAAVKQALSVQPNLSGRTLVIISLGPTEFADNLLSSLDQQGVTEVAARVDANLEQIRGHFAKPELFPGGAVLGLFSVLDPTDGMGTYPIAVQSVYCQLVAAFSRTGNVGLYNRLRQRYAESHPIQLLDVYRRFLGHGYFFADPGAPHYDAVDPSLWFQLDCLHPNTRGHHEIRRLIWQQLIAGGS